jgi:hypothetical protein
LIVWLASYPRSGNTYFRVILNRVFGIGAYTLYPDGALPQTGAEKAYIGRLDMVWPFEQMARDIEPYVVKTHELPGDDDSPAMYVLRDGRDALVSYAWYILDHFGSSERPSPSQYEQLLEQLIVSDEHFGGWSEHVSAWLHRPNTVWMKFETLLKEPRSTVAYALEQIGFQPPHVLGEDELPTFARLNELNPRLFRRGVTGGWQDDMPPHLHELFWDRHGSTMELVGYCRENEVSRPDEHSTNASQQAVISGPI